MNNTVVFMFSGQGSQYYHMGKDLLDQNASFRKWMLKLDNIIQVHLGESVLEKIYAKDRNKGDLFDRTLFTHPAIFMIEYALAQMLMESNIVPDYIMGSSLGEYTAATVAGVIDLEEAIMAIMKQARMLESLGNDGGMVAILDNVNLFDNAIVNQNAELAGINFDKHFVIAGSNDKLEKVISYLKNNEIIFQKLPVSQGFHSSYIDPIAWDYLSYLNNISFKSLRIPFISGSRALVMTDFVPDYFWEVIRNPMLFQKTIHATEMLAKSDRRIYIDLGPSGTLATFVKYILGKETSSLAFPILSPFSQDIVNVKKLKDFLNAYE